MLCIRAEIAAERPTPAEDQALRRSYQLQRLVENMGRGNEAEAVSWEALALEWVSIGPVAPATRAALLDRFRQYRT